jgi:ankyrin repeat protein
VLTVLRALWFRVMVGLWRCVVCCAVCGVVTGDVNVVAELLEQGDDVNCRGAQMRTPLHRAVGKGHNACVEVLIKHNADLNLADGGGLTPL